MNVEGIDWIIVAEKVSDVSNDEFTADQCRIKWVGSQSPAFNHSEWKTAETNRLFEILRDTPARRDGAVDWVKVTEMLGVRYRVLHLNAKLTSIHYRPTEPLWTSRIGRKLANDTHGTERQINSSFRLLKSTA